MSSSKKRTIVISIVVLLFLAVFVLLSFTRMGTSPAHANASNAHPACVGNDCDGKSAFAVGCSKDASIVASAKFSGGVTELWFSKSCRAGWGLIRFDKALPSGIFGDAQIARPGSKFLGCNDQSGQGFVSTGETTCFTPMLGDIPPSTIFVAGQRWNGTSWTQIATTSRF